MMICTKDVHNKCPFNSMCDVGCTVADNSECADYIMEVTVAKLKEQENDNEQIEAAQKTEDVEA